MIVLAGRDIANWQGSARLWPSCCLHFASCRVSLPECDQGGLAVRSLQSAEYELTAEFLYKYQTYNIGGHLSIEDLINIIITHF